MMRIALLIVISLFSHVASAADYYWVYSGKSGAYAEPLPACVAGTGTTRAKLGALIKTATSVAYECYYVASDGSSARRDDVIRFGDSCPAGSQLNETTGLCEVPTGVPGETCEAEGDALTGFGFINNSSGQCVDFTRADNGSQCKSLAGTSGFTSIYVSFDGDGNPITPPPTTVNGCETNVATVAHCTMAPARTFPTGGSIQPTTNKCRVGVSFTGNSAGNGDLAISSGPADDGVCDPATGCPDPDPAPTDTNTTPCVYVEDGEGRMVCSSNNYNYSPGNSNCGSVNGQFQCVGKAPTTNGITIGTTIKDTVNADGSKTSVKTDTATQVTCTGGSVCTSTTTTNTTTTNYNSSGVKTGQSTSCTGSACSPTGQDKGNCEPGQECTEEEEEGEFLGPENDTVPDFGESVQSFSSKVEGAPLLAAIKGIQMPTGGSCSIGGVSTMIGTISGDAVCQNSHWLDDLYFVFLAMGALGAVRILMSA